MTELMLTPAQSRRSRWEHGFTRRDLLACLCMVIFLAGLLLPALARSASAARSAVCLRNMKQLARAWTMYAEDHDGWLVHNVHGGDATGLGRTNFSPWASGWVEWEASPDNTNMAYLFDPEYARISPYIAKRTRPHKCPADVFASRTQRRLGIERVRSVSMNATVGHVNYKANSGPLDPVYRPALRMTDFHHPAPAEVFTFLDEHPDGINDIMFFPPQSPSSTRGWLDIPGNLHNGAAGMAFADGHAGLKFWEGPVRRLPVTYRSRFQIRYDSNDSKDRSWLHDHSVRVPEE